MSQDKEIAEKFEELRRLMERSGFGCSIPGVDSIADRLLLLLVATTPREEPTGHHGYRSAENQWLAMVVRDFHALLQTTSEFRKLDEDEQARQLKPIRAVVTDAVKLMNRSQ